MSFPSSSRSQSQTQNADLDLPLWAQIAQVQVSQTQYVSPVYTKSESNPNSAQATSNPLNQRCIPKTSTSKQILHSNCSYSYESTTTMTALLNLTSEQTTATTYISRLKPRGSVGWAGQLDTKKIEMERKSKTGLSAGDSLDVETTVLVMRGRGTGGASIGSGDSNGGVIKKS